MDSKRFTFKYLTEDADPQHRVGHAFLFQCQDVAKAIIEKNPKGWMVFEWKDAPGVLQYLCKFHEISGAWMAISATEAVKAPMWLNCKNFVHIYALNGVVLYVGF